MGTITIGLDFLTLPRRELGDGTTVIRSLPTQTGGQESRTIMGEMKIVPIRNTDTMVENGTTRDVLKSMMLTHYAKWKNYNFVFCLHTFCKQILTTFIDNLMILLNMVYL